MPDRPVHHGPHRGTGLGTGVNQRNGKRVVWPTPHDHCPPIMTAHGHPCLSHEDFSEVEQITLCAVNRTRHQHPDGRWDDDVDMSGNNRQRVVGQFVGRALRQLGKQLEPVGPVNREIRGAFID